MLIVDDHPAVCAGLERLLGSAGLRWGEVVTAGTLDAARRAMAADAPDVLMLDVDLNGEDGLSLLGDTAASTRVVVITSHADAATCARARRLGAHEVVDKGAPDGVLFGVMLALAALEMRGDPRSGHFDH